ncbi:type 4a pilus biogenesis protein PilO [Campylobacter sp. faydin G-24]|uniref:Type 4a pilus biogenesis protein PilO n=1 Tax=Campylobacter anatolicus TaxID=2829105 RepID=A0ABS5HIF6_9BACT|nr:type 4a pilus biogenesis protein PilO [Campylobacter anatolicus]MBR8464046.1 type 4a pilus biogenesis protein PilO [Campylobacter anatolicus]
MSEKILAKLDQFLELRSKREISLMTFTCAFLIIYVIFALSFESSKEFYNNSINEYENAKLELKNTQQYLRSVSSDDGDIEFEIKKQLNILKSLQDRKQETKEADRHLAQKLDELSNLLFDDEAWSDFLPQIIALAKQNDVKILNIDNKFKTNKTINADIALLGSFKNILGYIDSIERIKSSIQIKNLDINRTNNMLGVNMSLSTWSYK